MKKTKNLSVTSYVDGPTLVEMVFNQDQKRTQFLVYKNCEILKQDSYKSSGQEIIPYAPTHEFLRHKVLLFPEKTESYGSTKKLVHSIREYIHKYVDLSDEFEIIATHYVLLTWLFDCHNVLGYLRIRGDFGTGKTRFLQVIGGICYKPIFASGAATIAPLFHLLNDIGGTLIMDESDFYQSSEKSLIAKILNNGNAKGFPVLRCEKTKDHSFTTKSFNVFGPKILASRGRFDDDALESRFLTENAGVRPLRPDVPRKIGKALEKEALTLRSKLLQFRFDQFHKDRLVKTTENQLNPRIDQILSPLLEFMPDDEKEIVISWARQNEIQQQHERGMQLPAHVLGVLTSLFENQKSVQIGKIREEVIKRYGDHYDYPLTAKAVGSVVRNQLHLKTRQSGGRYFVDDNEKEKVKLLALRYGI